MKNITNTLKEAAKVQYRTIVDDAYAYGEAYLPYFIATGASIYWCKEEFMNWFCSREDGYKITFSGFDFESKTKESELKKIEHVFAVIEEWIDAPKNERTVFSYIQLEADLEDDYDSKDLNFYFTGLQINDSSFWLQSLVRMELFCCIYKSILGWNYSRLSKTAIINRLRGEEYFEEEGMIWALFNWRKVQEVADSSKNGEVTWLYNYTCKGILDAMKHYLHKNLDREEIRVIVEYEPTKSATRILLSKS